MFSPMCNVQSNMQCIEFVHLVQMCIVQWGVDWSAFRCPRWGRWWAACIQAALAAATRVTIHKAGANKQVAHIFVLFFFTVFALFYEVALLSPYSRNIGHIGTYQYQYRYENTSEIIKKNIHISKNYLSHTSRFEPKIWYFQVWSRCAILWILGPGGALLRAPSVQVSANKVIVINSGEDEAITLSLNW